MVLVMGLGDKMSEPSDDELERFVKNVRDSFAQQVVGMLISHNPIEELKRRVASLPYWIALAYVASSRKLTFDEFVEALKGIAKVCLEEFEKCEGIRSALTMEDAKNFISKLRELSGDNIYV